MKDVDVGDMETLEDIIIKLGGSGALAKAVNVKPSAASEMRRRGSIPVKYWPALIEAAMQVGVSLDCDTLVRLHIEGSSGVSANAESAA